MNERCFDRAFVLYTRKFGRNVIEAVLSQIETAIANAPLQYSNERELSYPLKLFGELFYDAYNTLRLISFKQFGSFYVACIYDRTSSKPYVYVAMSLYDVFDYFNQDTDKDIPYIKLFETDNALTTYTVSMVSDPINYDDKEESTLNEVAKYKILFIPHENYIIDQFIDTPSICILVDKEEFDGGYPSTPAKENDIKIIDLYVSPRMISRSNIYDKVTEIELSENYCGEIYVVSSVWKGSIPDEDEVCVYGRTSYCVPSNLADDTSLVEIWNDKLNPDNKLVKNIESTLEEGARIVGWTIMYIDDRACVYIENKDSSDVNPSQDEFPPIKNGTLAIIPEIKYANVDDEEEDGDTEDNIDPIPDPDWDPEADPDDDMGVDDPENGDEENEENDPQDPENGNEGNGDIEEDDTTSDNDPDPLPPSDDGDKDGEEGEGEELDPDWDPEADPDDDMGVDDPEPEIHYNWEKDRETELIFNLHTAYLGQIGNTEDGQDQTVNQSKLSVSTLEDALGYNIVLTGRLSDLDSWKSTDPSQNTTAHKWYGLKFVFRDSEIAGKIKYNGELLTEKDIEPDGESVIVWVKVDELDGPDKYKEIKFENEDHIEYFKVVFINEDTEEEEIFEAEFDWTNGTKFIDKLCTEKDFGVEIGKNENGDDQLANQDKIIVYTFERNSKDENDEYDIILSCNMKDLSKWLSTDENQQEEPYSWYGLGFRFKENPSGKIKYNGVLLTDDDVLDDTLVIVWVKMDLLSKGQDKVITFSNDETVETFNVSFIPEQNNEENNGNGQNQSE